MSRLLLVRHAQASAGSAATSQTQKRLLPLYGALEGIMVSDRDSALTFWAMERRQICWAHLLRKFVSFSERDGPAGDIGRELLDYTGLVFEYWQPEYGFVTHWLSKLNCQVHVDTGKEQKLSMARLG